MNRTKAQVLAPEPDPTDAASARPATRPVEDAVAALLGSWLVGGFFMDAWAHTNIGRIESIFTPWHAVLNSGFVAAAVWTLVLIRRRHEPGTSRLGAIPVGYGLGVIGIVVYGAGATTDLIGHAVFGFERGIAALISPSHLLIFLGVGLIALSPFRSAWARPDPPEESLDWFLPAFVPLTMVTALVCQVLLFLTIFSSSLPTFGPGPRTDSTRLTVGLQSIQPLGVGQIFVAGLVLTGPMLLVLRRWRPPNGAMTLYFGAPAALVGAVQGFAPKAPLVASVLTGVVADVLVRALRPVDRIWGHRLIGILVPGVLASLYLGLLSMGRGRAVTWELNVVGGAILISAIGGLVLSALIRPGPGSASSMPTPPGG